MGYHSQSERGSHTKIGSCLVRALTAYMTMQQSKDSLTLSFKATLPLSYIHVLSDSNAHEHILTVINSNRTKKKQHVQSLREFSNQPQNDML